MNSMHERDRDSGRGDRGDRGDRDGRDMGMDAGYDGEGGEKRFSGRRKSRPPADLELDYRRPETLRPFMTQEGKIVPSRVSRLNAHQQRIVTREIKRARQIALLPIASNHTTSDTGSRFGGYRDRERGGGDRDRERTEFTASSRSSGVSPVTPNAAPSAASTPTE